MEFERERGKSTGNGIPVSLFHFRVSRSIDRKGLFPIRTDNKVGGWPGYSVNWSQITDGHGHSKDRWSLDSIPISHNSHSSVSIITWLLNLAFVGSLSRHPLSRQQDIFGVEHEHQTTLWSSKVLLGFLHFPWMTWMWKDKKSFVSNTDNLHHLIFWYWLWKAR